MIFNSFYSSCASTRNKEKNKNCCSSNSASIKNQRELSFIKSCCAIPHQNNRYEKKIFHDSFLSFIYWGEFDADIVCAAVVLILWWHQQCNKCFSISWNEKVFLVLSFQKHFFVFLCVLMTTEGKKLSRMRGTGKA